MDDYDKIFRNLSTMDPNAGKFDVAEWLEDLFVDRRDAIVTHAKYLGMSFDEISLGLYKVADAFEGVDMSNGDAVAAATDIAKTAVEGMADAEFTPTEMKAKDDYDTGDNEDLGDEKLYNLEDGERTTKFKPEDIYGMSDELEVEDLGKDKDEDIDLADGETIEDAGEGKKGIDLSPDKDDDNGDEKDDKDDKDDDNGDEKDEKDDKDDDNGDEKDEKDDKDDESKPPPPTGDNFVAVEPDQSVYTEWEEKKGPPQRTYRSYLIDGEVQTDSAGRQIYWFNSEPYVYIPRSRGNSFSKWTEPDED
ncbi:hypothetical protein [Phytohabitans kaempferiae]